MTKLGRYVAAGSAVGVVGALVVAINYGASAAAAESLLSKNRPTEASSVETEALSPNKAVDGSSSTRWGSAEGTDPQWIKIDLGASRRITQAKLTWEKAYATSYQLDISTDGSTWKSLYSTASGNGGTDDLTGLSGKGRYVRLTGTARGTTWGYSLWEMKVYGSAAPSPSTTRPTASPRPRPRRHRRAHRRPLPRLRQRRHRPRARARGVTSRTPKAQGHRHAAGVQRGELLAGLAGAVQVHRGHRRRPRLHRRHHRLLLRHRRHAGSWSSATRRQARQRAGRSTCRRCARSTAPTRTPGLDPNFPATGAQPPRTPPSSRLRTTSATGSTSTRRCSQAKSDGLRALGQFIYYDAIVMHGPGSDAASFGGIRSRRRGKAKPPAQGGDEVDLPQRVPRRPRAAMQTEEAHSDTSRVDTAQRVFLQGQPRPDPPADLEGLRRQLHHRAMSPHH